ncbi:SufE family protein, partial [Leucobacter sp. M11]|uniref:SufE family protein n=1 Tax=Leucobacter sp. M11 TaxID=2993565 RepID=UPI002D80550D
MPLPAALDEIRAEFLELEQKDRLLLLLEFSDELPDLPQRYVDHPDLMERVEECQAPVFIFAEVGAETEPGAGHPFALFATAPAEAPTTRGFASILVQGLSPLSAEEVLALPVDFPFQLGLTEAVSPLRMRGMVGMLTRIKRLVSEQLALL